MCNLYVDFSSSHRPWHGDEPMRKFAHTATASKLPLGSSLLGKQRRLGETPTAEIVIDSNLLQCTNVSELVLSLISKPYTDDEAETKWNGWHTMIWAGLIICPMKL